MPQPLIFTGVHAIFGLEGLKGKKSAEKQLFHLQAKRFASEESAIEALEELDRKWKYHQIDNIDLKKHIRYAGKGSPTADSPIKPISLLVYSIAQRRMRNELKRLKTTLPNQIGKPVENPTLRWIFQLLEGIDYVNATLQGEVHCFINGITDLRRKILTLFGQTVSRIYQICPN